MDGDVAPLDRLADLAERYDAILLVDEAHATGVFGPHGRGLVEEFDAGCSMLDAGSRQPASSIQPPASSPQHPATSLHHRVHVRIGTLSKALGTGGGFVCGRQSLIDWLANRARTYVFSTAQPSATSAAAIAALDIVEQEPQRRRQLLNRAADLRVRLRDQGWNTGTSASQIIPLIIGDADRTMHLAVKLREAGYFIPGIRPPSVPEGESLLRLSLCYHHSTDMINTLESVLFRHR
jgi:7-keto-8-aminopelargonate synthetase-like enzyme